MYSPQTMPAINSWWQHGQHCTARVSGALHRVWLLRGLFSSVLSASSVALCVWYYVLFFAARHCKLQGASCACKCKAAWQYFCTHAHILLQMLTHCTSLVPGGGLARVSARVSDSCVQAYAPRCMAGMIVYRQGSGLYSATRCLSCC